MYDGRWNVEIYNTKSQMEFPADDASTPMDHIPPRSQVACVLQCGGIWIGGKGWGLTWKLFQCVVKKNQQAMSLRGVCNVVLDPADVEGGATEETSPAPVVATPTPVAAPVVAPKAPVVASPIVEDDGVEDEPAAPAPAPVKVEETVAPTKVEAPVVQEEPVAATTTVKKVVKKVVKKTA
jgi:hypothetical protein